MQVPSEREGERAALLKRMSTKLNELKNLILCITKCTNERDLDVKALNYWAQGEVRPSKMMNMRLPDVGSDAYMWVFVNMYRTRARK